MQGLCGLTVISGPVKSGKTTRLREMLATYYGLGLPVLCVNSKLDSRTLESGLSSHSPSNYKFPAGLPCLLVERLTEVDCSTSSVIGVDEAQFYPDLKEVTLKWLDEGKRVVLSGLMADFRLEPFGQLSQLVHLCEPGNHCQLYSYCERCFANGSLVAAGFSLRLGSGGEQIDTVSSYIPVCRSCHKQG